MTTEEFITLNLGADVRELALKHAGRTDIDLAYALDQIDGRRRALKKLPRWAAVDGIIYPQHISMEQCSSEPTALYKAAVARRLLDSCAPAGGPQAAAPTVLVDLTGGFGVDFSYLAPLFGRAVYVERQARLCDVSRHNTALLGITQAEVVCADSTQYIASMAPATMIYADPARRDAAGGRTFAVSDCTPDVLSIKETLLEKAAYVMIKLSPMLDWRKAVADMGGEVGEVHIVSVGGECKELLLVMGKGCGVGLSVHCVNDGSDFAFDASGIGPVPSTPCGVASLDGLRGMMVYEPNASVMKAGCFGLLERRFGVKALGRDSHLFVSGGPVDGFPGRGFVIERATTMNKRLLREALSGIGRANVAVRNFPLTVAELRRRLKLGEGGGVYVFATTLADRTHVLLVCSKATPVRG